MKQIASFQYLIDADTIKLLLEQHGIKCEIADGETINADPFLSNATGGVKVLVEVESMEHAKRLITKFLADKNNVNNKYCPKCESKSLEEIKPSIMLKVFGVFTLGLVYPILFKPYKCKNCYSKFSYYWLN